MALYSQGQEQSSLLGDSGALGAQGTSTSGYGYNLGAVKVYSGSAPANANDAETGTTLTTSPLPNPATIAPTAALPSVLVFHAIADSTILATNTAVYFRLVTNSSTGVPTPEDGTLSTTQRRVQGTVGTSATELIVNTTSLVSGGTFSLTSFQISHG